MSFKLLIVDDEPANLRLLERLFRHDYQCLTASSGAEAIKVLEQHDVATIITDQRMPEMTGIELLKHTAELRPHMVRILLTGYTDVEALVEAINCGLVYMYVSKPWNNDDLKIRVSRAVENYENNKKRYSLEIANERLIVRLAEMKSGAVRGITNALKARDEYVYEHSRRVSRYCSLIGDRMQFSDEMRSELAAAAFLHDVGKIGCPDRLLWQEDPVKDDDLALFQGHAELGADILSGLPELQDIAEIVRLHHENFDGSGYSRGLKGDQLPPAAKILRVADEYDLITTPRSSTGLSHASAMTRLQERAGKDFDPQVVEIFSQLTVDDLFDFHGVPGGRAVPSTAPLVLS